MENPYALTPNAPHADQSISCPFQNTLNTIMWLEERAYQSQSFSLTSRLQGPLSGFIIWQQSEKFLRPHALSALVLSMCVFSIPYNHRTKNLKSRNRKLDSKRSKGFILTQQRRKTRGDWEEKSPHSLINPFLHPPASTGSTQSALVSFVFDLS